jgi:hypothetical protein
MNAGDFQRRLSLLPTLPKVKKIPLHKTDGKENRQREEGGGSTKPTYKKERG